MSIESRSQRHRPKPRRPLIVAVALVAFAVLAGVGVALWPGDSWRDQAIAGVFPAPPAGGWDAPSDAFSDPGAVPTVGAASRTGAFVPAGATPSAIPTRIAPAPAPATSARATSPAPVTTAAPSPSTANGKGRHKPKPPPGKPSPTTSQNGQACLLGIIC